MEKAISNEPGVLIEARQIVESTSALTGSYLEYRFLARVSTSRSERNISCGYVNLLRIWKGNTPKINKNSHCVADYYGHWRTLPETKEDLAVWKKIFTYLDRGNIQ